MLATQTHQICMERIRFARVSFRPALFARLVSPGSRLARGSRFARASFRPGLVSPAVDLVLPEVSLRPGLVSHASFRVSPGSRFLGKHPKPPARSSTLNQICFGMFRRRPSAANETDQKNTSTPKVGVLCPSFIGCTAESSTVSHHGKQE